MEISVHVCLLLAHCWHGLLVDKMHAGKLDENSGRNYRNCRCISSLMADAATIAATTA